MLVAWGGHVYVVLRCTVIAYKYMAGYFTKGANRSRYALVQQSRTATANAGRPQNRILEFQDSRCVGPTDALTSLLGFPPISRYPPVCAVTAHLPDCDRVTFQPTPGPAGPLAGLEQISGLNRYFLRPRGAQFDSLLWLDYVEQYALTKAGGPDPRRAGVPKSAATIGTSCWLDGSNLWVYARQRGSLHARIHDASNRAPELMFLRLLLLHVPARGYADLLRAPDGSAHPTFSAAAQARGLTSHSLDFSFAMAEAVAITFPRSCATTSSRWSPTVAQRSSSGKNLRRSSSKILCGAATRRPWPRARRWSASPTSWPSTGYRPWTLSCRCLSASTRRRETCCLACLLNQAPIQRPHLPVPRTPKRAATDRCCWIHPHPLAACWMLPAARARPRPRHHDARPAT